MRMSRQMVDTRYVAISRVRTWLEEAVEAGSGSAELPAVALSLSNRMPEPMDLEPYL
jgi:hypothetical protein